MLLLETLSWILRGALRLRHTFYQMAFLGVNSTAIVILTTGFAGMVISLQLVQQAVKYGLTMYVGGGVAIAMARELAPMLTAVVVAGRAGSAIAAEISSMKVSDQIDALYAMAVSPVKYLVVPRFLALLIMLPVLTLFSNLAGDVGGALVAHSLGGVQFDIFQDSITRLMSLKDLWAGTYKAIIFSIIISMICCYQGLTAGRGAAGVGQATVGAVVYSMIMIFIANYILSSVLF